MNTIRILIFLFLTILLGFGCNSSPDSDRSDVTITKQPSNPKDIDVEKEPPVELDKKEVEEQKDSPPKIKVTKETSKVCTKDGDCKNGYMCNYSWICPRGKKCAHPESGQCRKKCSTDQDCSKSMPHCVSKELGRGDTIKRMMMCEKAETL